MPELPEVECVRLGLERRLVGARIGSVRVHRRTVVVAPGDPPSGWSRSGSKKKPVRLEPAALLEGARIDRVIRHGKQLAIVGEPGGGDPERNEPGRNGPGRNKPGRVVGVHLGMSGQLRLLEADARRTLDHVHVSWTLDDGTRLVFRDPRRFGGVWAHDTEAAMRAERWAALGPDALAITARELGIALRGGRASLKAALLDQRRLAGVGNIYADEAAFAAGVDPSRAAGGLSREEVGRLARSIRVTLKRAIERGGSSLRDYVAADGSPGSAATHHRVYGRGGQPCTRCGVELQSRRLAQRTTVWCPACQT